MSRRTPISPEQRQWLIDHKDEEPSFLAQHIGVHPDTMKRILMREGIRYFDAAKYITPESNNWLMWSRPCMRCKDTTPRPKWQYICDSCKEKPYEDE